MGQRHDYDTPWKEALARYLSDFFAFFFPDIAKDIDWSRAPRYLDKELRKLAPDSRSGTQITDTLVEVRQHSGKLRLVLVHVEVQSQEDISFASRMLDYHTRIRQYHKQPVCSLAILADPRPTWRPCSQEDKFWGTELRFRFPIAKLTDYRDQLRALETSQNPFALMVAATLHVQNSKPDSAIRREAKFRLVRGLYRTGLSAADVFALFRLVDGIMMLSHDQSDIFDDQLEEFERSHNMPYLTSIERKAIARGLEQGREQGLEQGREQGREQGLEQGREQGREQGLRVAIHKVLQSRFGSIPPSLANAIDHVRDQQRLDTLITIAVTAQTLVEVADALEGPQPA